jgi:hypothetical protein
MTAVARSLVRRDHALIGVDQIRGSIDDTFVRKKSTSTTNDGDVDDGARSSHGADVAGKRRPLWKLESPTPSVP